MRNALKMTTVVAACIAVVAMSPAALAVERGSNLRVSPVDLTKLATLANVRAEMWIAPASSTTLDDVDAVNIDWSASTETSFSAYRKTKMDPGRYRSIEFKN